MYVISATDILRANVLIVDSREVAARLLKDMLEQAGYSNITHTMNPPEAVELHRANHYKLILLDLEMSGMCGFQVMRDLNLIDPAGYVPVIAMSANPSYKLLALKAGAKDFIRNPFNVEEALAQVSNMLEVRLLHEDARDAAITHETLAQHDPLTGLGNRRFLTKRISAALANAKRNKNATAVLYLDLDGFKQINDTLGHSAGDALLKLVAQRLESAVREEDTVARVGGDEFMIILWQVVNASAVAAVARKLVDIISLPFVIEKHSVTVTTSIGVGIYPDHGEDAEALIKNSDAALYEAKRAGKNIFRISQ
jgi:two-component system, cell cycle response regulator